MTRTERILLFLIALAVAATILRGDEKPIPSPLSTTERLALSSLTERGRVLQEDTRAFYSEACNRRGITALEECSIDPTAMTVTRVVKPAPAPPAPAK